MNLSLQYGPSQIATSAWSDLVRNHPDGTVFQSPEMYDFFRAVPKFSPVVVGVQDENGRLLGILLAVTIRELRGPSAFFSSRTVIYGGPLVEINAENRETILDMLLKGLIRTVKNHAIFIQFRNFFNEEQHLGTFESSGFHLRDRLNLIVDTSSMATVIKNMSASRWRQIKKGLGIGRLDDWAIGQLGDLEIGRFGGSMLDVGNPESGTRNLESGTSINQARIIVPANLSQVRAFYDILYRLYRYKVKKPLPPWGFFEQFYHFSQQGKLGVILLVEYGGEIVGGILSPVTPGKTIYEWYVCGLDQEHKEIHPSVLATWAAMEYAIKHNIPQFDFMGVGIPGREYGVRDFKMRFGGKMVNYGRFGRINNRAFYIVAEIGYNFLTWFRKI